PDVVRLAPRRVCFDSGTEHIRGVRLTPRGQQRWFAGCCETPLGNAPRPYVPFIGMPMEAFRGAAVAGRRDELFGSVRAAICCKYATGVAAETSIRRFRGQGMLGHLLHLMLRWKLQGLTWPHPFFDRKTQA